MHISRTLDRSTAAAAAAAVAAMAVAAIAVAAVTASTFGSGLRQSSESHTKAVQ